MTTHVFSVPDISCENCKSAIEGVLRALPGVRVATVDVETATAAWTLRTSRLHLMS